MDERDDSCVVWCDEVCACVGTCGQRVLRVSEIQTNTQQRANQTANGERPRAVVYEPIQGGYPHTHTHTQHTHTHTHTHTQHTHSKHIRLQRLHTLTTILTYNTHIQHSHTHAQTTLTCTLTLTCTHLRVANKTLSLTQRTFNTTRVAGLECDRIAYTEHSNHICVLYGGVVTRLKLYVKGKPLSAWQIEAQLRSLTQVCVCVCMCVCVCVCVCVCEVG